jgi:starch synthase
MAGRRLRILALAYSCNPDQFSIALEGWSLSRALREHVEARVVTHARNRSDLEKAGWREGREFTAIDPGAIGTWVDRIGETVRRAAKLGTTWTTAIEAVTYSYFEHLVWQRFGAAIRGGEFDIVHRLTPMSPTVPSPIARLLRGARVPFVWGPINGGVPWPKQFRDVLRREGEWFSYLREGHRLLPGYAIARNSAAALVTGSICAWEQMKGHHDRCIYVPENAIDPDRFNVERPAGSEGPLRIAFIGRIVPYKGADILIEAVAPLIRAGKAVVDVIGDGPEMISLRRRVAEAQIGEGVALHGWVDHREIANRLASSQVFAFPSIREAGGAVVLEAMALGMTPVVIDNGGPRELVSEKTGYRVPLGTRASVVTAFRKTLTMLAASPESVRAIGLRARDRVFRLFTWDVKARQIVQVYRWVLGEGDKPDFGMPLADPPDQGPPVPERSV